MAKIKSIRWADKDDPIFTGRVTISSHRKKPNQEQSQDDLLDALENYLSSEEDE
jgi:hypothetical protein